LESAYETALVYDLAELGFSIRRQVRMPLIYKEAELDVAYRIDIIVNDLVVIEVKSIDRLDDVHFAQVLTYLRLSSKKLGLLINFNVKILKTGIHRVVNNL
jgi:GxxExxY protein